MAKASSRRITRGAAALLVALAYGAADAQKPALRFADQGRQWNGLRGGFYRLDQGSRLMPLIWFRALKRTNSKLYLREELKRYGYLPDTDPANLEGLPVGFSVASAARGPIVGLTCAACHTREIVVGDQTWRIDGGPGFLDFQSFLADLDAAVLGILANDEAFQAFASAVIGTDGDPSARRELRTDVGSWSRRFHTLMSRALPTDRPWGVARLDAFGMIYNRLTALDLGPQPDGLIANNVGRADAPVRMPFLWNSSIQDRTEWPGFANNGDDSLALARNVGEVYGVFGVFHPKPALLSAPLDHDYLGDNSANLRGLSTLEAAVRQLGPPVWPWPLDAKLATAGKAIFDLPIEAGGCVGCHGIAPGVVRGGMATWRTPVVNVGTDTRQWTILMRGATSGSLEGAAIPGVSGPLRKTDAAANILKTAVIGALMQANPTLGSEMSGVIRLQGPPPASANKAGAPSHPPGIYEARVLQGIWAAAPYLHNGSAPSLADLLKPAAERPKAFRIGRFYDIDTVGLAALQPGLASDLKTTGCEDITSGDSNCGHDFGTHLPDEQKRALLEYLKSL